MRKFSTCCNIVATPASSLQMNWTIFHQDIFPIRHKLYRFALRITGSAPDAEDVVQEVLERVWKTAADQSASLQN